MSFTGLQHFCLGSIQPQHLVSDDAKTRYITQAALALDALHALNVLHRDIKPDNMLLRHDSRLLLNDYDVSCTTADVVGRSTLQVGTPAFTSPWLDSVSQVQYQFRDDWLSLGLSFAHLVNLYPKSGGYQVKLDALKRLQQQVWCPASIASKIQEATKQ